MRASRAVAAGAAAGCAPAAQQAPAARQKMRMHIGVVLTRVFLSPGWPASPYDVECDWPSPAFVDTPTGASMRLERPMARRKRRKFTDEFKDQTSCGATSKLLRRTQQIGRAHV